MAMTREQAQAAARARRRRAEVTQQGSRVGLDALSSSVQGGGQGLTLGFSDEMFGALATPIELGMQAYRGEPLSVSGAYTAARDKARGLQEQQREENPGAFTTGEISGAVAAPIGAARAGLTLLREGGNVASRTGRYAVEGAAYGGLAGAGYADGDAKETASDVFSSGALGALVGAAAPAAIAGVGRAVRPVADALKTSLGPASSQAAQRVGVQMRAGGLDDAALNARLSDLGQEGILADVMGARGQALARAASNVSPEARATLEGFTGPRQAMQPERMVAALEEASGLPAGNRLTVEGLKSEAYERAAPGIRAAYDRARQAGYDLPLEDFQEIIGSPMGKRAFAEASRSVQNRMAAGNEGAVSNLALLDAMKRRLDAMGQVAGRAGDADKASQAQALSQTLRAQMDGLLEGGEYQAARAARQAAYRTDEAFDVGAELASPRVALDAPGRARAMTGADGNVRPEVGQGYAAELSEGILNRRGTPDALNRLSAPMQREAMEAALGERSGRVQQQLSRERTFGETHRALTGNSTTARQLAEMGVTAGAGAGIGLVGGLDPTSAGMAGIAAALTRRGATAAVTALRAGNEEVVAKEIAKILVSRGVPTTPQGVSVALRDPRKAQFMARLLAGGGGAQAGATAAQ